MSDQERQEIIQSLIEAVNTLERYLEGPLIPDSGLCIAYATEKARDLRDVAMVQQRIRPEGERISPVALPTFGEPAHTAGIVLTAMKFDPEIRSAAVIRYTKHNVNVLKDLLYEVCYFDRMREPPGISTMDWGVASCCRDGVPDAVFDCGAPGKEALIRIFAENPAEVVGIIVKIQK